MWTQLQEFKVKLSYGIYFHFRNAGLGMCSSFGRLGSITSPLIFIIGDLWAPLPFVVFGVLAIIGGLLSLLLPETKGKNLADNIKEGEQLDK